jgi:hypothetical protein
LGTTVDKVDAVEVFKNPHGRGEDSKSISLLSELEIAATRIRYTGSKQRTWPDVIGTDNTIVVDVSQALNLVWPPYGDRNQQIIDTDVIGVIKMVGDPIIPGNSTPSNPKADSKTVWSAI